MDKPQVWVMPESQPAQAPELSEAELEELGLTPGSSELSEPQALALPHINPEFVRVCKETWVELQGALLDSGIEITESLPDSVIPGVPAAQALLPYLRQLPYKYQGLVEAVCYLGSVRLEDQA